jgi:hypothetical protein
MIRRAYENAKILMQLSGKKTQIFTFCFSLAEKWKWSAPQYFIFDRFDRRPGLDLRSIDISIVFWIMGDNTSFVSGKTRVRDQLPLGTLTGFILRFVQQLCFKFSNVCNECGPARMKTRTAFRVDKGAGLKFLERSRTTGDLPASKLRRRSIMRRGLQVQKCVIYGLKLGWKWVTKGFVQFSSIIKKSGSWW